MNHRNLSIFLATGLLASPCVIADYSKQEVTARVCVEWWFSSLGNPQASPPQLPTPLARHAWGWASLSGADSNNIADALVCISADFDSDGISPLTVTGSVGGFSPGIAPEFSVRIPVIPVSTEPATSVIQGGGTVHSSVCGDPPVSTFSWTAGSASSSASGIYDSTVYATQLNLRVSVNVNLDSEVKSCKPLGGNSAAFRDWGGSLGCSSSNLLCFDAAPSELDPGSGTQESMFYAVLADVAAQSFEGGLLVNADGSIAEQSGFSADDNGDIVFSVELPASSEVSVTVSTIERVLQDLDLDGDSSVTCDDVFELARLVTQFGGAIDTLDDEDLVRRFNLDAGDGLGIVDAADVALFQRIVEAFFEDEPCLFLDVNRDGVIDPCDVAYARAQSFVSTDADVRLDQNQDGAYDQDDLDLIIAGVLAEYGYIDGDVNGDFLVDLNDYSIIAVNFGMTGLPHGNGESRHLGDLNDDGKVDLADFGILAVNFGSNGCP